MQKYKLPDGVESGYFSDMYAETLQDKYSITIIVVGKRTGISKTWSTLKLAEMFDPKGFTAQDVIAGRYCFYADEYIDIIRKTEPYRWVIFDEPGRKGSGGSKQEWQSELNRALASTAQVSRFKLPVSAFIVPHRMFIATHLFGLAQLMFVFEERGYCKIYHIEVSEFDGNIYTPYWGSLEVTVPSHELAEAAEAKKEAMWMKDTQTWIKEIQSLKTRRLNAHDVAEQIREAGALESLCSTTDKGARQLDVSRISAYAKCGMSKSYEIKRALELELKT